MGYDTTSFRGREYNAANPMIGLLEKVHQRLYSWALAVTVVGLLLFLFSILGCTPKTPSPSQSVSSGSPSKSTTAYPLKILLVESGALQSEIELRWQAFSDQELKIQTLTRQELVSQEPSTADLLIFPAHWMGTLVARDWIAPVPKQIRDRIGGWGLASESNLWPSRWRALSMYGGKPMAVPLGAPSWVAITRSLDTSPLKKLQDSILGNELNKETSEGLWNEFLSKAEAAHQATLAERELELQKKLSELTPEHKRNLACRYLWLLSSTESRYRGLFDMYKLIARCNQPEFARAAIHLRRLGVLQPSTIFASPTDAWQSVAEGDALFALGWPRTDNEQRLNEEAAAKGQWEILPMVWNDGSGLMASIGGRTRQSAKAAEFLLWLASEEQRIPLQVKSSGIELLNIEDDRNRIREDYREYQTLMRTDFATPSMELTPRFLRADQFMSLLEDALLDIFKDPESCADRMARCRQDWDALVAQLGRESLRSSLEAASGYTQ